MNTTEKANVQREIGGLEEGEFVPRQEFQQINSQEEEAVHSLAPGWERSGQRVSSIVPLTLQR